MIISASNADELFDTTLNELLKCEIKDEYMSHEIVNANIILTNPTHNTMCKSIRKMPIRYAIGELLWYNSANPTWRAIYPFSKFWEKISDDGETINSNYGWCIRKKFGFDQWEHCKKLLQKDVNSRQAIIHIKEARDLVNNPTKDLNCTIALQFLLRDGKLDLIVTMRSNDIWLGLPYDLFNFTCFQIQMAMELNVNVGTYYHNVGSLHLYKKDYLKLIEDKRNGGTEKLD